MKPAYGVTALIAALAIAGCGGSVASDTGAAGGGKGGAASGGGGSPSSGGSGGVSESSCGGLDEVACQAHPVCRADYCSCPGVKGFVGCSGVDSPPTPCPFSCPLMPCTALTKGTDCQARSDCHAVFLAGDCGCDACCCTFFDHCADGGSPDCKGPATCSEPAPDCTNPDCNGTYALSYLNGCYEGCVLAQKCAGP